MVQREHFVVFESAYRILFCEEVDVREEKRPKKWEARQKGDLLQRPDATK